MKGSLASLLLVVLAISSSIPTHAMAGPYPGVIYNAGPYAVEIESGGIGMYLAPRGVIGYGNPWDTNNRGGMAANSTQVFIAKFVPGSFFQTFPGQHVGVMLWGSPVVLPATSPSYQPYYGRGVAIGAAGGCNGIAIENFTTGGIIAGTCVNHTFTTWHTYELIVHASSGAVYYRLRNLTTGVTVAERSAHVTNINPDPYRRDIIFAHTADDAWAGIVGGFRFFEVYDGYF